MKIKNSLPTNKIFTKSKDVQEIHQELVIGGGDCDLYLDAYIDGELVVSKKSDSMLGNFLKILHLQMGGYNYQASGMPAIDTAYVDNVGINVPINISALSSGNDGVIRINFTNNYIPSSPTTGFVSIQGTQGTSNLVDGIFTYTRIYGTQADLTGTTYNAGYTANSASARFIVNITAPARFPSYNSFGSPYIVVGTGTTAVALADYCLAKEMQSASTLGRLTYNAGTVSLDTYDSTSSQITFTRTFTNNNPVGSADVAIEEIGMYCNYGYGTSPYEVLIMRDLASIAVAVGKVLTVNYRIKSIFSTGTNPGGFLNLYTKLLYRHFAQAARAVMDINNTSRAYTAGPGTLKVVNAGGEVNTYTVAGSCAEPAWKQGIVIGTGSTAVSQGDYFLATVIAHGSASGQMIYYGGLIQNYTIAGDGSYHSFDIVKTIENNSGGTITVGEIALIGGAGNGVTLSDSSTNEIPIYLFMMSRNVLTTPVDVLTTKILKVTYTVKIIL